MRFFSLIVFTVLFAFPAPIMAEDAQQKSLKIAVINVQELMSKSKAAKNIHKQGKKLQSKYQGEIESLKEKIQKKEKDILKKADKLSEKEFLAARADFQKDLKSAQIKERELNQKIDRAVSKALAKLGKKIKDISDDLASDNGYDMVIPAAGVLSFDQTMDITDKAMDELNDALPKVKVKE